MAPRSGASLRPAKPSDAAFIAESLVAIARDLPPGPYSGYFPQTVTPREFDYALAFIQDAHKLAVIAEDAGLPVGCLLAETHESAVPGAGRVGHLAACRVAPEARGMGVARALAERAETWFRAQGLRHAELSFGAEAAGAAWKALGYAPFRTVAAKDLGDL